MKMLMCGVALSFGLVTSGASAAIEAELDLTTMMENCRTMTGAPEAQIACFNAVSELLKKQAEQAQDDTPSIPEALAALREAAEVQNADTGLKITGTDCKIHVLYFNNYFHISRRNVSTIDLFSAQFDAADLDYDQSANRPGAQPPLSRGVMASGTARVSGGVALDSKKDNFDSKSARASVSDYADEVIAQLPTSDAQSFDFVLVHPDRQQASNDIWASFEAYVKACAS